MDTRTTGATGLEATGHLLELGRTIWKQAVDKRYSRLVVAKA